MKISILELLRNMQLQRKVAELSQKNDRHSLHFCYDKPKQGG